jgi:MFS family permease
MTAHPVRVVDWRLMTTDQPATQRAGAASISLRNLTIGLCMTVVAIAFESIAVATAMPAAARDLDGVEYYAWLFSLFVIGMLFSTVVTGRLSDRIGPARPLLVGLVIFAAGLVVAGTAQHMAQLIAGRLVQGLGSGVINTAIFVCVAQAYSVRQRPRMFTYISTAWVLPSFVGPPVAAWLTLAFSWHWVFIAVLPLVALGGAMVLPTLLIMIREYRPEQNSPPVPPASLWAAGLVAVAAAAIQLAGQRLDWIALGLLVVGVAGLVVGLPRLMPPGFPRLGRGLSAVILVRGLLPGAHFGSEAFIPLMLVEQRKIALVLAGAVLTVGSIGWTTGSWLQSRPWLKIRRDRLITYGCLSVAVGVSIVATVGIWPGLWFGLVGIGWIFSGFGMGLAISSTSLAVMTLSEASVQGRNASSLNLFDALCSGVFVGLSGTVFAALRSTGNMSLTFGVVYLAMAIVSLLAVGSSLRIGRLRNEFSR